MPPRKKNPHAVALGRLGGLKGGRSTSAAKQAAVRENGKLGGRPRKSTIPRAGKKQAKDR